MIPINGEKYESTGSRKLLRNGVASASLKRKKKERISNEEEKKSGSGSFLMVISITREGVNNSRWLVAAANTHYRHHR